MKTLSEVLAHLVRQTSWFSEADRDDALEVVGRVADLARGVEKEVETWVEPDAAAAVSTTTSAEPTATTATPEPSTTTQPIGTTSPVWSVSTPEPSTTSDSSSAGEVLDATSPAPSAVPGVDVVAPAATSTSTESVDDSAGAAVPNPDEAVPQGATPPAASDTPIA